MALILNQIISMSDDNKKNFKFLKHRNQFHYFKKQFNHINKWWNDIDFLRMFRMKKPTFMHVLGKIKNFNCG